MATELTFEDACELVRRFSGRTAISNSDKRLMYVYYKVATVGLHPDVPAPSRMSPRYQYWEAWSTLGPRLLTPDQARRLYVEKVRLIQSTLE